MLSISISFFCVWLLYYESFLSCTFLVFSRICCICVPLFFYSCGIFTICLIFSFCEVLETWCPLISHELCHLSAVIFDYKWDAICKNGFMVTVSHFSSKINLKHNYTMLTRSKLIIYSRGASWRLFLPSQNIPGVLWYYM